MTRTKSTLGISAAILFGSALLVVACGSDSNPGGGTAGAGGNSGTAGLSGAAGGISKAGAPSMGGAGGASAGAGGTAGSGGAPNNCTKLPANMLLTDFSPATFKAADGTSWTTGKTELWGSSTTLSGGDVFYQGKAASAAKVTVHGQTLTITASVQPGDYMGYMFNFKPACTNASTTQGLKFDVGADSTLGNATLKVQMQQKSDYPSTANPSSRPGDCVPTSVDTQYNDCLSPAKTVAESGSTLAAGPVELPWTAFSGGQPVSTVDNTQLMAIQWQFECPPGGGAVDAAGGSGGMSGSGGASAGAGTGGSSAGAATAGSDTGGTSAGGAAGASAGTSGDPGAGGVSGSSGASGSGGTSGSSGSAGSDAGSSGTSGSAGTAGSAAGAGGAAAGGAGGAIATGGTAGAGVAGSAGATSTPSPCVVSLTIDNVTFY